MDDVQKARELIIESILKSGSVNSINAHFLSLVTKALNGKLPKKSNLGQILTPIKQNSSLSNEIANEIVFDFFERFSLNYSLSTIENETKKTVSSHHDTSWILEKLKFTNEKDTPINQLIHQHDTNEIPPKNSKEEKTKTCPKPKNRITKGARKKPKNVPTISRKPINNDSQSSIDILGSSAVPTGISKNEWEERKLRTMESQSEESSTVNLSDLQPQYTIDSFGNSVQRAIGELVCDQDFDNLNDSSSSKQPRQSGNQRQGDSLQSAFSESAKENERKKDMIQTFESDSKEIEDKLNNDLKDQLHSSSSKSKKKTIKKSKKNVFDKMSQSSVQHLSEVPLTQMSSDYLINATQDHLLNITKQESSNLFLSENSSSKEYSEKSSHKSSSKRSNNLHEAPVLDEDNYQNQKDALAETFKPKEIHVDNSFEDQQIEEEEESDNEIDHQEIEEEELESDDESGLKKLSTGPSEEDENVENNSSSIVGILGKSAMENAKDESDHKNESSIISSELNGEEEDEIFLSEESPLPQGERNDQSPLPQSDSDIQSPFQHLSSQHSEHDQHLSSQHSEHNSHLSSQHSKSAHSVSQNEHITQSQHSSVQPENQSAKSSVLETSSQYSKQFYSSSTEKENPLFENIRNVILVSTESEYSSEESENEHKLVSDDSKSKSSQRDLRMRQTKSENQPNPKRYKFEPTIEITNVADFPYHSSRHSVVSRDIEEFNTVSKSLDKENKSSVISEPQSSVVSETKTSVVSKPKSEKPDEQEYSSASYERQSIKSKKSKSSSRISHHTSKVQQKQPEVNNKEESQAIDFSDEESEFTRDFNNIDMSPWSKPTKFIKKHDDSDSEIDTIIDVITESPSPSKTPKHLIRKSTPQKPKEESQKEIEDESYEYESSYSKSSSHAQSISNSRHSSAIESNTKPSKVNNKSESSSIKSYSKRSITNNQQPIQNRKDTSESMKSNSKQSTASNQPIERNQLESSSIHSTASNQQSQKDKLESSSIQSIENSQSRKDKLGSSSIKSNSKQSTTSNQIIGRNNSESASVKSIASNKQTQPINNRKDKSESSSIKSDSIVSDHQPVKQNQPIKTSVARSESSSSRSSLSPIESKSNSQVEIKQKSRDNSILSNQKSEYSIHDELSNIESYSNAFSQEYKSTKVQPKQQITKPVVVEDENTIDNDEFIEEEEKSSEVVKQKPSTQVAKPSSLSKKKATSYNNKPKQQQKKNIPAKPTGSSKHSSVIEQKPIKQVNEQPKKEVQRHMDVSFDEEFENENQIEEEAENEVQLSKIEEEHQLNVPSEILNGNQSSPLTESESDSPQIPNTGEQISPHVFKRPMIMNQYTLNQPSNLRRVQRNVSFTNEDSDIDSNQFGGNLADPFNRKAKKIPKVEKKPPSPVPSQTTETSSSAYESNFSFEYANTKSKKAAPKPQSEQNSSMSKRSSGISGNSSFDQSHDFSSVFEQVKSKPSKKTAVNANSKESSDIIDRSIDIESTSNHISEIDEEPKKEPILKSSLKNQPKSKYQPVSHSPYSITSSRKAPSTNRIVSPYSQFPEDNLSVNSLANKKKDVQYDAMSFSEFFDTVVNNDNRSQNREIRQPGIVDRSGLQSSSTASVVSNHLYDFSSESLFSKEFNEAKVVRFHHPKVQSKPKSEEASQASIESVQQENEQQPNEEEEQNEEEFQKEEEEQIEVEPHNEEEQIEFEPHNKEEQIEDELQKEEEQIEVEPHNEEEQFEEEEIGEVHQIEEEQLIEEVHQIEQPVEEVELEEEESSSSYEIIPPPKEIKERNIVQPNHRTTQNDKNERKDQPVVKREAVIKEDSSFSSQSGFSEEFDQNKKKILRPISHKTEKFTLKPKQEVQQKPQVRSSNSSQISEPNSSSCFSDVFTKTKAKQSKQKVTKPNAEHSANSIISDILSNDISSKPNSNEPSMNSETSSFSNNFENAKPSKTKKRVHKTTTSSHSSVVSNDNQPKDQKQSKNDEQSFSNVFTQATNKKPKAKKQFIKDKKNPENDSTISSIVSENSKSQKDGSSNLQDPKKFDDENSLSSIHKTSSMSPENSMKSYSSDQFAFTPKTKGQPVKPQNEIVPPRAKIQPKKQVDDSKKKVAQPTNNQKKEIALTIDVSLNSLDNEDLQFDIPSPTDQKREFNSDLDKKEGSNKEIEVISDLSINSGFMNDSLLSNDGKDANEKKKTTTKKVNTGETFGKSNVKTLGKDNGSNIDVVIELDENSEY